MTTTLYVGAQPDPRDRRRIEVDRADGLAVLDLDPTGVAVVLDLVTAERLVLRRADCGAGCRCAVELVPLDEDGYVDEPIEHACIEYAQFDRGALYPYCGICGYVLERAGDALVVIR